MKKFKSEAYKDFLKSHTGLNYYIKISCAAVSTLHKSISDEQQLSSTLNSIITETDQGWVDINFSKPHELLKNVINDLAKSGIIWVYSAFDLFFKKIEGQLSSKFTKSSEESKDEADDKSHKLHSLYEKLGWDKSNLNSLLPIFRFYEAIRHSVAHNVGLPSGKLISIYGSVEFNNSISNWKTKYPSKQISPPPIIGDKIISLEPHHAITYSETCLRIVTDINQKLLVTLGVDYFIERTFKKHLLDTPKLTKPYCENLQRYISHHLNLDYGIPMKNYREVYAFIGVDEKKKDAAIKAYKTRYAALKKL